ncbi:MAG: hypothetical protein ABSH47_23045 [Bryobacteraceae bacterium]|jgi:CheY-like chemotaxis protein
MFRFLVVEDVEFTLSQIVKLLKAEFAEAQIDTAATVRRGTELIEEAARHRKPYDAAVLDFRLPLETGTNPEVDESLCLAIREKTPSTLVAHITSFITDPRVARHLAQVHSEAADPKATTLDKEDVDWGSQLVSRLKSHLYGWMIELQMNDLFGTGDFALDPAMARSSWPSGRRSITPKLAALTRGLEAHYEDLEPRLQRRIDQYFAQKTVSGRLRFGLRDLD